MELYPHKQFMNSLDKFTQQWFNRVLIEKGYLHQGEVTGVRKKFENSTFTSFLYSIELKYSDTPSPSIPVHFFLKIYKPDSSITDNQKEVEFYRSIAPTMPGAPLSRCYSSHFQEGTGHLLLEDLSRTHFLLNGHGPLPPPKEQLKPVIDLYARFHGFWWNHPALGKKIGSIKDEETFKKDIRSLERIFPHFVDFMKDRLSLYRRELYERVLASAHELFRREILVKGKALTLTHGDAHPGNIFYPRDPSRHNLCIVDWSDWEIAHGTDDMAYMIALHYFPHQRQTMEKEIMKQYHGALLQNGITGYDWDECWKDYRLSVIKNLFVPIYQWYQKLPATIWYYHMERAILAFEDLDCLEFLKNPGAVNLPKNNNGGHGK